MNFGFTLSHIITIYNLLYERHDPQRKDLCKPVSPFSSQFLRFQNFPINYINADIFPYVIGTYQYSIELRIKLINIHDRPGRLFSDI